MSELWDQFQLALKNYEHNTAEKKVGSMDEICRLADVI